MAVNDTEEFDPSGRGSPAASLAGLVVVQGSVTNAVQWLLDHFDPEDPELHWGTPAVAAEIADGDARCRMWCMHYVSVVAEHAPDVAYAELETITAGLSDPDPDVRTYAFTALGRITKAVAAVGREHIPDAVAALEDPHGAVRKCAMGVLGDTAEVYDAAVVAHTPQIAAGLADENAGVRHNAALALLAAGRADPPAVRAEADRLLAALEDPDHSVRANVCVLLGNVRPATGRERLAAVADADPDMDVREKARWALGRLGW